MTPALALPERPRRARGRLQLLLILAVVIGPMMLASAMYHLRFWVPDGRSYHGTLIGNGQQREDLGVQGAAAPERWQLLVTAPAGCAADCQQLVYLARQINIGLGREANRADHALALGGSLDEAFRQTLERDYPRLARYGLDPATYSKASGGSVPQLWIVDPHGNLVLRYDGQVPGKRVLDDLRHLLKLSNIG
ncbi:hypothetical protein [Metapseudomonas otitidis]|uniref:hypothetical protein n=1 Tax=Metapseudomonas otitidis TaxID=319939 RepID=UPI001F35BCBC|nr:hypothetical protein [Pseudomonas otitidis]